MKPLLIAADFSHWNGNINFRAIAAAGIKVAMVKASEGSSTPDPMFHVNKMGFTAVGVSVIPYHFMSTSSAQNQVSCFVSSAGIQPGDCVAWDWESQTGDFTDTASPATVNDFIEKLEAITRRDALRYHGRFAPFTQLMTTKPWWLPQIRLHDNGQWWGNPARTCLFHQYTFNAKIAGELGNVDRSSAYAASTDSVLNWIKTGQLPVLPASVVVSTHVPEADVLGEGEIEITHFGKVTTAARDVRMVE